MIIITSKKDGFRRCGVAHPTKAVAYPDDKFSEAELDAMRSEPMLTLDFKESEPSKDKGPFQDKPPIGKKTGDKKQAPKGGAK